MYSISLIYSVVQCAKVQWQSFIVALLCCQSEQTKKVSSWRTRNEGLNVMMNQAIQINLVNLRTSKWPSHRRDSTLRLQIIIIKAISLFLMSCVAVQVSTDSIMHWNYSLISPQTCLERQDLIITVMSFDSAWLPQTQATSCHLLRIDTFHSVRLLPSERSTWIICKCAEQWNLNSSWIQVIEIPTIKWESF